MSKLHLERKRLPATFPFFFLKLCIYIRKKLVEEIHRSPMECNGKQDGQMHEKVCDLVVFPMEKTSKASREASDCKSPSWPRKALPTHYSSLPRPKGKKASVWTKTKATSLCYYHTYQFLKLFNLLNKMFILSLYRTILSTQTVLQHIAHVVCPIWRVIYYSNIWTFNLWHSIFTHHSPSWQHHLIKGRNFLFMLVKQKVIDQAFQ